MLASHKTFITWIWWAKSANQCFYNTANESTDLRWISPIFPLQSLFWVGSSPGPHPGSHPVFSYCISSVSSNLGKILFLSFITLTPLKCTGHLFCCMSFRVGLSQVFSWLGWGCASSIPRVKLPPMPSFVSGRWVAHQGALLWIYFFFFTLFWEETLWDQANILLLRKLSSGSFA